MNVFYWITFNVKKWKPAFSETLFTTFSNISSLRVNITEVLVSDP